MVVVHQPVLVQRQGEPVLGGPGKLCLSLRSNVKCLPALVSILNGPSYGGCRDLHTASLRTMT